MGSRLQKVQRPRNTRGGGMEKKRQPRSVEREVSNDTSGYLGG